MLRYIKGKLNAPKSISPWIDQAKIYFLDSTHINWRSAGLLYYYSFLNLAKALLVASRKFTYKSLDTISIYHGLHSKLQDISSIIDYEIQISPLTVKNGGRAIDNIFSNFYQVVTGNKWPYQNEITVKLGDVLGYCLEIAVECKKLFNIERRIIITQSLYRTVGYESWFEMAIPDSQVHLVKSHISDWPLEILESSQLSDIDRDDWLTAYPRTAYSFDGGVYILRSPKKQFDIHNKPQVRESIMNDAIQHLYTYFLHTVYDNDPYPEWQFISDLDLDGKKIKWHPLLSDYLMAFVLSTILRYQPQLLQAGTPNYHLAEGWCSQSAITALKYFLMLFTNPPLRVEMY